MTRCTNLVPPSFSCQLVLLLAASSSHRDLHLRAFAEEGADVVDAQVHVAFADLDDPLCVRRLEHQHRQKVGRFCLAYAECARQQSYVSREPTLVLCGEPAQIDGGAEHEEVDRLQTVALLRRNLEA